MSRAWIQEIARLLALIGGMLFIGLLTGEIVLFVLFLFVALLIYLGWHLYNPRSAGYLGRSILSFLSPTATQPQT